MRRWLKRNPVCLDDQTTAFGIYRYHKRKIDEIQSHYAAIPQLKQEVVALCQRLVDIGGEIEAAYKENQRRRDAAEQAERDADTAAVTAAAAIAAAAAPAKKRRPRKKRQFEQPDVHDDLDALLLLEPLPLPPPPLSPLAAVSVKLEETPPTTPVRKRRRRKKSQASLGIEFVDIGVLKGEARNIEHDITTKRKLIAYYESRDEETDYTLESYRILNEYMVEKAKLSEFERLVQTNQFEDKSQSEIAENIKFYNQRLNGIKNEFVKRFFPNEYVDSVDDGACLICDTNVGQDMCPGYDQLRSSVSPVRQYCYLRINHFREIIRQRQGKSRVNVPPTTMGLIDSELRKFPIVHKQGMQALDLSLMKAVLKRLRLSKYYEHAPFFTKLFNPEFKTIDIPADEECMLCQLFAETEAPFTKYKAIIDPSRKNFLSYMFIARKLLEKRQLYQFVHAFPLLKSQELLAKQCAWWKLVCDALGWEWVRTVGRI
jgi:hypothetical protein